MDPVTGGASRRGHGEINFGKDLADGEAGGTTRVTIVTLELGLAPLCASSAEMEQGFRHSHAEKS